MASKGRELGNIVSPQTGIAVTFSGDPVVLGVGNTEHVRVTGAGDIYLGGYLESSTVHNTLQKIKVAPYNWTGGSTAEIASIEMGATNTGSDDGNIIFKTATNVDSGGTLDEAMRIRYDGNVGIGTDNPLSKLHVVGGNIKVGSGYGIDFSATSDGTGANQSELLDDYEEGTWTPKFVNSSNGNDYFVNNGLTIYHATYVKIGEYCWASAYIANDSSFSYATGMDGTQNIGIGGLPFTVTGSNAGFYPISIGYYSQLNGWSAGYTPMGYFHSANSRIVLTYATANTVSNVTGVSLYSGGSALLFSGYYKVA